MESKSSSLGLNGQETSDSTPKMATTAHLPPELLDGIFEMLSIMRYKETLADCCLASQDFLALARRHLWYDVQICALPESYNVFQFIDFLRAEPDIRAYIRKLRVSNSACADSEDRRRDGFKLEAKTFRTILTLCPSLISLNVHDVELASPPDSINTDESTNNPPSTTSAVSISSTYPIHKLVLSDIYGDPGMFYDLIRLFSEIRSLEIMQTTNLSNYENPIPTFSNDRKVLSRLKIRSLSIEGNDVPWTLTEMITHFALTAFQDSLQDLDVTFDTEGIEAQFTLFGSLIRETGPRLRHLRLSFYKILMSEGEFIQVNQDIPSLLNLSSCTSLDTCQLSISLGRSISPDQATILEDCFEQFNTLTSLLSCLMPHIKTELTLSIATCIDAAGVLRIADTLDWGMLDDILTASIPGVPDDALPNVMVQCQYLRFDAWTSAECYGPFKDCTWQDAFTKGLPRLWKSGRLQHRLDFPNELGDVKVESPSANEPFTTGLE
ncbi:hypothetical protein C8Q75DRAFT_766450 [Abortiporus biennis]|nr:hypothetical protein C8Q75DRAFT_766450 [Abortiporus biennis]